MLDHVADMRAVSIVASALDDPVARVRRNAAHALGCLGCKPGWEHVLPPSVAERLSVMTSDDPNKKVRDEAAAALRCVTVSR